MAANMIYQYLKLNIKRILQYKADFFIGVLPHLIGQLANLAFFKIILGNTASIKGWDIHELLFLFGFSTLVYGVYSLIFGNFHNLKSYLFQGQFDIMRIRPTNLILHIMVISFRSEALEQILLGIAIAAWACTELCVSIDIVLIATALYFLVCAVTILGGLTLFASFFLFITQGTFTPIGAIFSLREYTKYPLDIFGSFVQFLFSWIIPIGYVSFYPSHALLGHPSAPWFYAGIVAAASFWMGYTAFQRGLYHFDGVSA